MQSRRTLTPGQKGTKKFLDCYGEPLFCVRDRYDEQRRKRFTSVELMVDESDCAPSERPAIVGLRVELKETDLQRRLKQAGGIWNRQLRLWQIRYDQAVALKLEDRIEPSTLSNSRKRNGATGKNGDLSTIRH